LVQILGANTWCKHNYTYIHTITHTYTQVHIHTHNYTYIHTITHTYTQVHIHTHKYTYIHTSTHTCTRVYALAHTGFAELEYGMLRFMNSIDEKTLVVTTVHDCQVGVVASHNMRGLVLR